jgi:hypothetical protein
MGSVTMYDLLYVAATIAFFALMLAFVKACQRIAGDVVHEERRP